MKILILGAGNNQVNAIKTAKSKGHTVIVSDYYEDAPGKEFADYSENVSTFDIDGNIKVAHKYNIDGVMTLGTDQPVFTGAKVAHTLKLPQLIDLDVAKAVTNKKVMKELFYKNNIPTVKSKLLNENFNDYELEDMKFPVVVKPLDSQGQRGVYKLYSIEEVHRVFHDVLSFSRENEILIEEFYPSDEITVNGWVEEGKANVLSIVDRISYQDDTHIGICIGHRFPSKYMKKYFNEIIDITEKIVKSFKISNGPIYFQMLVGQEDIKVNEIACRIGGAYEDLYLHKVTGVDMLDMLIDASLGKEIDCTHARNFDLYHTNKNISVEMFFAKPCTIHSLNDMEITKKVPGVLEAKHNFKPGKNITKIVNATQRAGFMIIEGNTKDELEKNIKNAYETLGIYDKQGNNMLIRLDQNS